MNQNNTLVINCGSSSIKFAVINVNTENTLISGLAERLGSENAVVKYSKDGQKGERSPDGEDHQAAISCITQLLTEEQLLDTLVGVGHRIVHGGEQFSESMILTAENMAQLETLNHLAPLHNPVNLLGVRAIESLLPALPQVAVFDTAFHQSIPAQAYLYGLPYEYYEAHGARRYGFHGTSFRYVSAKSAEILNKSEDDCCFLAAHLGNGCSATAILNGKSVDSSMGLTPLEGLVMGTRTGDIDPGMAEFLCQRLNMTLKEIMNVFNKKSGLLGLSGVSNDMREIQAAAENGHERANLAIEVFAFRIARYLGALAVSLPRIDALIFTGGIGENDRLTRSLVLEHLAILGFEMDGDLNAKNGDPTGRISTPSSRLAIVVPTDEELMIAKDTASLVR